MLSKYSFRLFGDLARFFEDFFPDLKDDLKRAGIKLSSQEYLASSLFVSIVSFLVVLPFMALFLSIASGSFLFSYLMAISISLGIPILVFFIHVNYPKTIIKQREKDLEKVLPFSTLYLSSIVSSGLPFHRAIKFFVEFSDENEFRKEIKKIVEDIDFYGLDINSAIERAINRSPSKKFKEFLYGLLATTRSGGNLYNFFKEKSNEYMMDYRRKLYEFSRAMTIYIQIYLISIVLGTIFFTVLTSVISVMGAQQNILGLQTLMIFIFLPAISILFIFLVKKSEPSWE
ncbi:MAG: type II secretion system F family protein [Candidatus Aenigmatarchaeota archaeon]